MTVFRLTAALLAVLSVGSTPKLAGAEPSEWALTTSTETRVDQPQVDSAARQAREQRARDYFGDDVLTDQDGRRLRFFSDLLRGRTVLINVIFTNCDDACPLMTKRLRFVREQLGAAFGDTVYFLSLSVDPERDTPEALKAFAERHKADEPGWRFLVADRVTLRRVLKRLGQWTDDPQDHMTLLIAGNASNAHWTKLRPDASPAQIADQLLRL